MEEKLYFFSNVNTSLGVFLFRVIFSLHYVILKALARFDGNNNAKMATRRSRRILFHYLKFILPDIFITILVSSAFFRLHFNSVFLLLRLLMNFFVRVEIERAS